MKIPLKSIKDSIDKGIDFLYESQLDWGEFKTFACWNPWMIGSYFDSSPFITTFVLYSIKDVKNEKVKIITKRAIDFLLSEQEKGGIWRFWTSRNKKRLPPDLDDICTISFILKLNNVNFDDNLQLILNNKNKDGLFLTWITEKDFENNFFWKIVKDNVDCVVNANVLLYLGKNDSNVCSYINQMIKSDKVHSIYYPSKLSLFYMVSRAFKNNITCFGEQKEKILKSIFSCQKEDGSFGNDLETALALNTLLNFNYKGKEIDYGVNFLLQRQLPNGSWERAVFFLGPPPWFLVAPPFYRYYGSEALTTALAIEALQNYLNSLYGYSN
jgi:hypothetical protein